MARITFSATVDEIIGKLGGSVFQYSLGGWQVHVIGKPRNPQTQYQQLRRGNFGFLSSSWRGLTSLQRQSFIDNLPAGKSSLNFFIETNVNLILVDIPTVTTYIPGSVPTDLPCEISDVSPDTFLIKASGPTTVVPANTKLLIYSTVAKPQTRIFTNPSEYSPIISYDEGTDLSADTDILSSYVSRYGQLKGDKYLCIKSVLISKINGSRGAESITCSNTEDMANKYVPLQQFNNNADSDGTVNQTLYSYNLPANTLSADGMKIKAEFFFDNSPNAGSNDINFVVQYGGALLNHSTILAEELSLSATIQRSDTNTMKVFTTVIDNNGNPQVSENEIGGVDFTNTILISITCTGTAGGSVSVRFGSIDLVKV